MTKEKKGTGRFTPTPNWINHDWRGDGKYYIHESIEGRKTDGPFDTFEETHKYRREEIEE